MLEMDRLPEQTSPEPQRFSRRTLFKIGGVIALAPVVEKVASVFSPNVAEAGQEDDAGLPVSGGRFFTETNAGAGQTKGYFVTDNGNARFYSEFNRLGGIEAVGYPVSRPFKMDGFTVQAFQRVIFQWRPEEGRAVFVNVFDKFSQMGLDDRLFREKQVPYPKKWDETGKNWDQIVAGRLAVLNAYPALEAKYYDVVGDPIQANGLPTSEVTDMGNQYAIRCQRVVIQLWKEDVPWAKKGQAMVALGGDFAKEFGLVPAEAMAVEDINGGSTEIVSNSEPAPQVQIPDLPSGGIHDNQKADELRQIKIRALPQYFSQTDKSVQGLGLIDSWRSDGNKIILTIIINGEARSNIEFYPTSENRIWFYAARVGDVMIYQAPDLNKALIAFNKYFVKGDPMYFFRRTDGLLTSNGFGQRVTTHE